MRTQQVIFAVLAGLFVGTIELSAQLGSPQPKPTEPVADPVSVSGKALVRQVRDAATQAHARFSKDAGAVPLTSVNAELFFIWSERVYYAERTCSSTSDEMLAAANLFVDQIKDMGKPSGMSKNEAFLSLQHEYYRAIADSCLMQISESRKLQTDYRTYDAHLLNTRLIHKAAADAVEGLAKKSEAVQEGIDGLQLQYLWSSRLAAARTEIMVTSEDRLAIYKAHLDRMTKLRTHALPRDGAPYPKVVQPALDFYVAEAQWLVPKGSDKKETFAKERINAAEKYLDALQKQEEVGPVTSSSNDLLYVASRKLKFAQIEALPTRSSQITAATAHQDRMAALAKRLKSAAHPDPVLCSAADFYLAEAKFHVFRATGGVMPPQK